MTVPYLVFKCLCIIVESIRKSQTILNESSKPPVNKRIFQYSSFIIKLFEMTLDTVYLGTLIRRLYITKFDPKGCSFMRNDMALIPVLHVAHDAKCYSICVYSYFHRQLSDTFIISQKYQRLGCMTIK